MKNFLIVLLMIVIIAGTGYGVYYQIDNHNKKNETSSEVDNNGEKEEVGESIDVNSDMVTVLMDKFAVLNDTFVAGNYAGYFYKEENYDIDSIDNNVKLILAANQIYSKIILDDTYIVPEPFTATREEMKNEIDKIFGNNVEYIDDNIILNCKSEITYDVNNQVYSFNNFGGCGGVGIPYIETKVESATKYSDKLEIIERVSYIKFTEGTNGLVKNVYKNTVDETLIGTLGDNDDVFALYGDKLNSYKYTFNYENGNYYFSSVELVK